MENGTIPSFNEYAKAAKEEMGKTQAGSVFLSKLPPGVYPVQFLGATMVKNNFGEGYIPEFKFNHDGIEKSLLSSSKALAGGLLGKEGQTVILEKGVSKKTGRTFWGIK